MFKKKPDFPQSIEHYFNFTKITSVFFPRKLII